MAGSNRLAHESSPYLRQHADNPVDWRPWGEEAFAEARERDVPVLLSIGYSACHWCHVMAHESFEDEDTAAVMNEHFVNIKVDREQRPDVDAVYMEATQAMTGHGGWPMTVFLTPDGEPFQCGTYYPKQRRHGMPAFVEVLAAIEDLWRTKRADLLEQAAQLTEHLQRSGLPSAEGRALPGPDGRRRRGARAAGAARRRPGRVRPGAEVPPVDGDRPVAALRATGGRRGRGHLARGDGVGRACGTTSAAASPGTRSTTCGSCRTSRRCCTTRPCCCGPTSTAGR